MITITLTGEDAENYIKSRIAPTTKQEPKVEEQKARVEDDSKDVHKAIFRGQSAIQDELEKPFKTTETADFKREVAKPVKAKSFKWSLDQLRMLETNIDGYEFSVARTLDGLRGKLPKECLTTKNFKQSLSRMGISWKTGTTSTGTIRKDIAYWADKTIFDKVVARTKKVEARNG